MKTGWVCFYRKITEWEWYSIPGMLHIFFHLIVSANHKDGKWRGVEVKRGQLITGLNSLNDSTGISIQSIRTCLTRLEQTGEITRKSTNKFTIITLCNYNDYQDQNNDTNKQTTVNQQTTNKQLTTNNNKNNENNTTSPEYSKNFASFWEKYPKKKGKAKAYVSWKRYKCENGMFEVVMESLESHINSDDWKKDGGKWIPHGSTWVHGKGWEDEIETTTGDDGWK